MVFSALFPLVDLNFSLKCNESIHQAGSCVFSLLATDSELPEYNNLIHIIYIIPPLISLPVVCHAMYIQKLNTIRSSMPSRFLHPYISSHTAITRFNPLKPELNPICYMLALLAHYFLHVSRIRVKSLTIRLLMSYIYGAPILDVSRSYTTTRHSR